MTNKILMIDDDPARHVAFKLTLEDQNPIKSGLQDIEIEAEQHTDPTSPDLRTPGVGGMKTRRNLKAFDENLSAYIVTASAAEFMAHREDTHDEGLQLQAFVGCAIRDAA